MYKISSELCLLSFQYFHAICSCGYNDFLTAKSIQHIILLWLKIILLFCRIKLFFFNAKPQVQKKPPRAWIWIDVRLCIFHVLLICFDSVASVYPLHWKSSRACPFACSLDSWPAMNCVLKGLKERVNEVKINEAREHHHLKAVSSSMPHL